LPQEPKEADGALQFGLVIVDLKTDESRVYWISADQLQKPSRPRSSRSRTTRS
jgi:hypothetical protein